MAEEKNTPRILSAKGDSGINAPEDIDPIVDEALAEAEATPAPEWPNHFPDDCPCTEDAQDASGAVYRFVDHHPITDKDMESYLEKGNITPGKTLCQLASLSVYPDRDFLVGILKAGKKRRNRRIARADLKPEYGKLKQTNDPPHHSLWLRREYHSMVVSLFQIEALP